MKPMTPEAQALLQAARTTAEAPPPDAQRRIRALLDARIAAGDPGPADVLPTSASGGFRRALLAGLLLLGVAAGLLWKRAPEPQIPSAPEVQAPRVAVAAPPATPTPEAVPAPPPVTPAPEAVPAPPAIAPRKSVPHVAAVPPALAQVTPQPAPEKEASCGLAEEVMLLQQAERDLRSRHAEVVLTALQQASKACPGQGLEQERLALQVLALCQLGRAEDARTAVEKLEKEAPQSPSLGRIHSECGELITLP